MLGRTQVEVKSTLSVAIAESQHLDVSLSGDYTVAEWLRLWFDLYARPNVRPSTVGTYHRAMEECTISPPNRKRQAEQAHQPGNPETLQGSVGKRVPAEKADEGLGPSRFKSPPFAKILIILLSGSRKSLKKIIFNTSQ